MATLRKFDFVGESVDPHDSDIVKATKIRGVRALEEISEVSIIAVPDINIQPRLHTALCSSAPLHPGSMFAAGSTGACSSSTAGRRRSAARFF